MVTIPPAAGPKPGATPNPTAAAPANTGGAVARQPNLGNQDQGLQKVIVAAKALEEALPSIPMGTPLHGKLLKMTTDINKVLEEAQAERRPQQMIQTLLGMARQAHQTAPMQALARISPQAAPATAAPKPAAAAA